MNKYYVYKHIDPFTNECVYVGQGSSGRAWMVGSSHSPHRAEDHNEWGTDLLDDGITPDQFVEIIERGLTKEESLLIENALIREIKPIFNRTIKKDNALKFTPSLYREAIQLREQGLSYDKVGKILGLSTMTIHRGLNGGTINLEVALERE